MSEVKFPSNCKVNIAELTSVQTYKDTAVGRSVLDYFNAGVVALYTGTGPTNGKNFIITPAAAGYINVGKTTGTEFGGVAYDDLGRRIVLPNLPAGGKPCLPGITSATIDNPVCTFVPPWTTPAVDPYGATLLESSGNLDVPLKSVAAGVTNYVYISYIQEVDTTKTVIDKEPVPNKWYTNYTDGYKVTVNTTGVVPANALFLGTVTDSTTIDQTGMVYSKINPESVLITTPATSSDVTTTYAYGATYSLNTHIKAQGTGTMAATNPHGMSLADLGIGPDATVGAHQQYLHRTGLNNVPVVTINTSALYPYGDTTPTSGIKTTSMKIQPLLAINATTGAGEFLALNSVAYSSTSPVQHITPADPTGTASKTFGVQYDSGVFSTIAGTGPGVWTFYIDNTTPTLPKIMYTSSYTATPNTYRIYDAYWDGTQWDDTNALAIDRRIFNSNAPVNIVADATAAVLITQAKSGNLILDNNTGRLSYYDGASWICLSGALARRYLKTAFPANPSQKIVHNASTKIQVDGENYDIGSNFVDYRFVVPRTGYYQVNAGVAYIAGVAGARYMANLYNASTATYMATAVNQAASTKGISANISDILYLTAGNYLELYTYQDSGVDAYLEYDGAGPGPLTFISIQEIK